MAWAQQVVVYFKEESTKDGRDEYRETDERSCRWRVDQSMKQ